MKLSYAVATPDCRAEKMFGFRAILAALRRSY